MRSKLLLLALLLSSCTLKTNEQELKAPSLSVTSAQQGCLANSGSTISKFFDGEITEPELDYFWNCLTHSFQMFADNTRGTQQDYYAPEELAGFMSKYFLKGKSVPAPLLRQAMNLKKGVMGGSSERITRQELKDTVRLIKAFHEQSLKLRPYMPLGSDSILKRTLSDQELEFALQAFQSSMQEIGKALEGSIGTYSISDFNSLLVELKAFMYEGQEKNWIDTTLAMAAVIGPAKSVFVAPPATEISQNDWPQFFYLVPRYFALYLRSVYYFQTPKDYQHGAGLLIVEKVLNEGVDLIGKALENHPSGRVETEELDALLKSLDKVDLLPDDISRIRKILVLATTKIFPDPESRKMQISKANLKGFRETYLYFTEGLHGLESVYRRELGDADYLVRSMDRDDLLKYSTADFLKGTFNQDELSKEAVEDLRRSAREVRTIFPNAANVVFVPHKRKFPDLSYFHMAKMHLFRTINRLLLRTYGGSHSISENQIVEALRDMDPVLEFYKIDSKDLIQSVHPRLFEASLFLPSSDGLTNIKMTEALEMEALLISTIDRHAKIHEYIASKCKKRNDRNGDPTIEPDCYRRQFTKQIKRYWDFIPGLADFTDNLSPSEQLNMFQKMDAFLRKGRTDAYYTKGDTKSFVLMPYYIELLFSRFDANNDNFFDEKEAKLAYPVFEPFIAEKANALGYTKEEQHYKIFTYILAKKTLPKSFLEKIDFLAWDKDGEFKTNRGDVVTIFATLLSL